MADHLAQEAFNHICLPPWLPPKREENINEIESHLTDRMIRAICLCNEQTSSMTSNIIDWKKLYFNIQRSKRVCFDGYLNKELLIKELRDLSVDDILILHIVEQNAGLLIWHQHMLDGTKEVVFEAFEASAKSENVLAAKNGLAWTFPGNAAAVSYETFRDPKFLETIATFCEKARAEALQRFSASAHKAGVSLREIRDTANPDLITQMLITLLGALGRQIESELITKHVHDDVVWGVGNGICPWRRSAWWLVLRVGVQRYLNLQYGTEIGTLVYKVLGCAILRDLLIDFRGKASPENSSLTLAKLSRRLAKIESQRSQISSSVGEIFSRIFDPMEVCMTHVLDDTNQLLTDIWRTYKGHHQKRLPHIPAEADHEDITLRLKNSQQRLWDATKLPTKKTRELPIDLLSYLQKLQKRNPLFNNYYCLFDHERDLKLILQGNKPSSSFSATPLYVPRLECTMTTVSQSGTQDSELCRVLAQEIGSWLETASNAFHGDPQQSSRVILLTMELWIAIDQCSIRLCPIIGNFAPPFKAESFDILQLLPMKDMQRLQDVQNYILLRHKKCHSKLTIFSPPRKGCFADVFFQNHAERQRLADLHMVIKEAADEEVRSKHAELTRVNTEYEELSRRWQNSICDFNANHPLQCQKCYLRRQRNRLQISAQEYLLPADIYQARAVVLELYRPNAFVIYRNSTWKILVSLAKLHTKNQPKAIMTLPKYGSLNRFSRTPMIGVTLASVKKSFLCTHYGRNKNFPIGVNEVCFPHSCEYAYFDQDNDIWTDVETIEPTFAHHCALQIPETSPFFQISLLKEMDADAAGITSNEAIVSQVKCPSGLGIHEWVSYQSLCSGNARRWLGILVELGSSNLNFGTEAVVNLITRLALHSGPSQDGTVLRRSHSIFEDVKFCEKLAEQIQQRLTGLEPNWRETLTMSLLLKLALRLRSLGKSSRGIMEASNGLLAKIRETCSGWLKLLNAESNTFDPQTQKAASSYAFHIAILVRETFQPIIEDDFEPDELAFRHFVGASLTLQKNLITDIKNLNLTTKRDLVSNLSMVRQLAPTIQRLTQLYPQSILDGIRTVHGSFLSSQNISGIRILGSQHDWWAEIVVDGADLLEKQTLHVHIVDGILLVNSQEIGKLPPKHAQSLAIRRLFGDQPLRAIASSCSGMELTIIPSIKGHTVHVGFCGDKQIVRAWNDAKHLWMELIPQEHFAGETTFDLPAPLVNGCVHWFYPNSRELHIRSIRFMWKTRSSDWILNLNTRQASRKNGKLVDPMSPIFERVSKTFAGFEDPKQIVVFQAKRSLQVQLQRLRLNFKRSKSGGLVCYELNAETDPNQDIGTWYGLSSKLVLRNTANHSHRHVLVPTGIPVHRKLGIHVDVSVANNGEYARYTVNEVLGRIESPQLPSLLYQKAMLHACTSFCLPDDLTGRTGTEEALYSLGQGLCQPWQPLKLTAEEPILRAISKLAPQRLYYPRAMKQMQEVHWDHQLPFSSQHDELKTTVEDILEQSRRLATFYEFNQEAEEDKSADIHLKKRGAMQRRKYQRPNAGIVTTNMRKEVYISRDRPKLSKACENVYEIVSILEHQPWKLALITHLHSQLEHWPIISGYDCPYDQPSLTDHFSCNLGESWGRLVRLCLDSGPSEKYHLMMLFASISFDANANMGALRTIVAFSIFEDLKRLDAPHCPLFTNYEQNARPTTPRLEKLISFFQNNQVLTSPSLSLSLYQKLADTEVRLIVDALRSQWPSQTLSRDSLPQTSTIDIQQTLVNVAPYWEEIINNQSHSRYIEAAEAILKQHFDNRNHHPLPPPVHRRPQDASSKHSFILPSLESLVEYPHNSSSVSQQTTAAIDDRHLSFNSTNDKKVQSPEAVELRLLTHALKHPASQLSQDYKEHLVASIDALVENSLSFSQPQSAPKELLFPMPSSYTMADLNMKLVQLNEIFNSNCQYAKWLEKGKMWPCVTWSSVFALLRSTSRTVFGTGMKPMLMELALAMTHFQRLKRVLDAEKSGNMRRLHEEHQNTGHGNWDPLKYPDWVLMEIDSNLLIRDEQVEVALATISPESEANSVVQLQMGKGKTSCIMPMAAAALADRKHLVRLVVPKALLLQTAQVIQGRLGGMVGRKVRHIPFSRKTPSTHEITRKYSEIHQDLLQSGGVLVTTAEQCLSFKLNGFQQLSDNKLDSAKPLIEMQKWLDSVSRDILDESDQILSVRTQLIYPGGAQRAVDGYPWRWEIAENFLQLVQDNAFSARLRRSSGVEILQSQTGSFPVMFFLQKAAEDEVCRQVAVDMLRGRVKLFPANECSRATLQAIKEYISLAAPSAESKRLVRNAFPDNPGARYAIHLARGLLVYKVLTLCLKKRYNVHYGLHPERDPIAVPYLAKGVPSQTAEWGHTDVGIILTILSFYYGGLNRLQLREVFQHLLRSNDPGSRYDRWLQLALSIPHSLKHWNAINTDDDVQLTELWNRFRLNTAVIDDYLNFLVFPRHARQFDTKIQNSGWDLVLSNHTPSISMSKGALESHSQKPIRSVTTGFSGTSDNRYIMPLNIKQADLPGLAHTDAEVLTYLLQPRNRSYIVAADQFGKHLDEISLLELLQKENLSVLIDAGAQISEHSNYDLVKQWLVVSYRSKAAAFFDGDNNLKVIYRDSDKAVPFSSSPFAEDMTYCLMYFDQAHTRGADVKLLPQARAALTLALEQTKDDTVQAAMRMRQLATTQSIVWVSPPQVHQSILNFQEKPMGSKLDSHDVISWLMAQSLKFLLNMQPLFLSQGSDYLRKQQKLLENPNFLVKDEERIQILSVLKNIERETLVQMYGFGSSKSTNQPSIPQSSVLWPLYQKFSQRRSAMTDHGLLSQVTAFSEVEQEREIQQEVELVREVQKPTHFQPYPVPKHLPSSVKMFVNEGLSAINDRDIEIAFKSIKDSELGRKHGVSCAGTSGRLFISEEFKRTVKTADSGDNFFRSANWVLYNRDRNAALLVSPEEAELVISTLRQSSRQTTHLLTYAAPVTRAMMQFNDLKFFSVPSLPDKWEAPKWLSIELGIFAGRVYFEHQEYADICTFLGIENVLSAEKSNSSSLDKLQSDGVVSDNYVVRSTTSSHAKAFVAKPLSFLQAWLDLRRKGSDFKHTPMGYVSQGKVLGPEHFFFRQDSVTCEGSNISGNNLKGLGREGEESDDGGDGHDEDLMDLDEWDADNLI